MIRTTPKPESIKWESIVADLKPDRQGWWDLGDGEEPEDWFGDLPIAQQQRLSQQRLQDWLYRRLVSGVWVADADPDGERRVDGLDLAFAGALHRENQGTGYWDGDWLLGSADETGHWAVSKSDLTIDVWPETDLMPDVRLVSGQTVSVKLPKNLVIADRYMAVGNAGQPTGDRCQLFIHCDRQGVLPIMREVTQTLNDRNRPFSFAVPYEPLDYPRWDVGSLIMGAAHGALLQTLGKAWGVNWVDYLLPGEVRLAQPIGPGLAIAPLDADMVDFGWARCRSLAANMIRDRNRQRSHPRMK
jgi:HopA1 effector protein family